MNPAAELATRESASAGLLRRVGLKLTHSRLLTVRCLQQYAAQGEHATVERLYRALLESGSRVSLGTIYRTLAALARAGLVKRRHFADAPTAFELVDAGEHHHIVDARLGAVVEFSDALIEQRLMALAAERGYQYLGCELTLYVRSAES